MPLFASSRRAQTLADQIVVSGSNFVTSIILVRGLGLLEFGKFTVAYTILMLANSLQLSFISSTMITLGSLCHTREERDRFVHGIYGVQIVFCAITTLACLAAAVAYLCFDPRAASIRVVPAFASAVFLFLMQDWLRRYYFTVGKGGAAVWNDTVRYVGQIAVLLLLMAAHGLTIETAFWSVTVASGVAFAAGAIIDRLKCTRAETAEAWRQARGFSIDLGIANQLQWLVYQGAMLVGAGVAGPQAAGGVRATQNVIGPVNIAYQAMDNIVPIRAAEELRRGGSQKAASFLFRFGAIGFALLLVFFSAASLLSARFLSFFYGHGLHMYAGVLNLQMLYFLLVWPGRQLVFLFRTIRNTRPILHASIVAAALSMSLVYPLVRNFGALGIVMAAVAGQIGHLIYLGFVVARVYSASSANLVDVNAR